MHIVYALKNIDLRKNKKIKMLVIKMANYDFKELSSYDFELLIRDLLQEEYDVTIESFKSGRDNGIDLRYAKDEKDSFIVQCKHYANSTYNDLKTTVKKEAEKLKNIDCKRYILVTSQSLTPNNKEELLKILSPYCKSTGDILGQNDVNNLIGKYPKVEKDNYKLWLTSTNIMERILHSKVYNQSIIEIENIRFKSKFYVQNKSFFKAKELLKDLNYCIITGIPGIGKTTLAEILILYYLEKDYEVYNIVNTIEEAFEVYNPHNKQLFYYDDFLGQTTLEDKLNKNEDSQIIKFIDTVGRNKNSKFILTTREYIINQAKLIYEKISNFNFDISKCSINLNDYTKYDKAKILFNHLYFSNIPNKDKEEIVFDKKYKEIVNHLNYNPRIIEWMTIKYNIKSDDDYYTEFMNILDNPHKIWGHIYNNQLKLNSKNLLLVLVSLPDKVYIEELRDAFEEFNIRKAEKYGYSIDENDFMNALRELEGNFISTQKYNKYTFVYFSNPSIRDFMENRLCNNLSEFKMSLMNSIYFSQIQRLCTINAKVATKTKEFTDVCTDEVKNSISRTFISKDLSILKDNNNNIGKSDYSSAKRLVYLVKFLKDNSIEDTKLVEKLFFDIIDKLAFSQLRGLFDCIEELIEYKYTELVENPSIVKNIKKIIMNYGFSDDIEEYFIIKDFDRLYPTALNEEELNNLVWNFKMNYKGSVRNIIEDSDYSEELKEYREQLEDIVEFFNIDISSEMQELDNAIDYLIEKEDQEEPYDDYDEDAYKESRWDKYSEDILIDNMFDSIFD